MKKNSTHRSAKHNKSRSRLKNLAQVAALNQQAGADARDGQDNSSNARLVHAHILQQDCGNPSCIDQRSRSNPGVIEDSA